MADISAAIEAMKAGRSITREGIKFTDARLYIKKFPDGTEFLYIKQETLFGEEAGSYEMDWNDMTATNWKIVN